MASLLFLNEASSVLPREPLAKFRRGHPVCGLFSDGQQAFLSHFPMPALPAPKPKAVFVLGSSGTGKSRLAISLALRFDGEVINSDKMQVYDALSIITNKVTAEECAGVPHHLLGGVHPDSDFTAAEFRSIATAATEDVLSRGRLPIIAGGSNSYIKELVAGDNSAFARRFDCCFICVDVDRLVLEKFVAERVDRMVEQGMVEEARGVFVLEADYTRGVRRSIGVPELDRFFRQEAKVDEADRAAMLATAIEEIKANTCWLTRAQREKIRQFEEEDGWRIHRVDATEAVLRRNDADGDSVWEETVVSPCIETVWSFVGGAGLLNWCGDAVAAGDERATAAAPSGSESLI